MTALSAHEQAIEAIYAVGWGAEPADDGAWIVRSLRQDLLALAEQQLDDAAAIVAAQPYAVDAVVTQLAQLPGALRLDPVPIMYSVGLELPSPLILGHHRGARNVSAPLHIWRPVPKRRSKQRHVTLCGTVMTEAPGALDRSRLGLRLCRDCSRMLVAIQTGATQTPEPDKPVELSAWVWELNTRTIGALGYWRLRNHALGFATSDVHDPQEAVTRALKKLRDLLRQALRWGGPRPGVDGQESAVAVVRAYGWPIEPEGTSWRLMDPGRIRQESIDEAALIEAAQALRNDPGLTFDALVPKALESSITG